MHSSELPSAIHGVVCPCHGLGVVCPFHGLGVVCPCHGLQSNEPDENLPANGARRMSSGFFFARSDDPTIEALEAVVEYGATTGQLEQPSFYDVLCGDKQQFKVPYSVPYLEL